MLYVSLDLEKISYGRCGPKRSDSFPPRICCRYVTNSEAKKKKMHDDDDLECNYSTILST